MKVLFFTRLFHPHIGGVETHVLEISRQLIKDGHKVTIITENHSWTPRESYEGIKIYRMPVGKSEWFKKFWIWTWLLFHMHLMLFAEVIHCHDVFFWYLPFRVLFFWKKVYITFHGHETHFPPEKNKVLMRKLSEYLSFGNICVGKYIESWYETRPTYIIYGGADVPAILPTPKKHAKTKIIFIGRLEEDNGIEVLLNSLLYLRELHIQFTFEAYGDGSYREYAEKMGKVYGFIENVKPAVIEADIVFASSYLSMLQAFALKTPVFAAYTNVLKDDYLHMTPFAEWIVAENDAKKMAEKIAYFLKHKDELQEMVSLAFDWVKTQSWEHITEVYYQLWNAKLPSKLAR